MAEEEVPPAVWRAIANSYGVAAAAEAPAPSLPAVLRAMGFRWDHTRLTRLPDGLEPGDRTASTGRGSAAMNRNRANRTAPVEGSVGGPPDYASMSSDQLIALLAQYGLKAGSHEHMVSKMCEVWAVQNPPVPGASQQPTQVAAAATVHAARPTAAAAAAPPRARGAARANKPPVEEMLALVIKEHVPTHERILMMESVDVDAILQLVGAAGNKCSRPAVVSFLEGQGISYLQKRSRQASFVPARGPLVYN